MRLLCAIPGLIAFFTGGVLWGEAPSFDGDRALRRVAALTELGARPAAGANAAKAAGYLKAQFVSFGYQVTEHRFPMLAFEDLGTQVTMEGPEGTLSSATALLYSPSGHLQGEVVAVPGAGLASDFETVDLKGKIALVARGGIYLREKAACAARAGAVAVIIHNSEPGAFIGTLGRRAAIPAIALSGHDGRALRMKTAAGAVTLCVDSDTLIEPREGINVIATKPGTSTATLLFGAHYDGVTNSVGANDNASGTAVMLELARALISVERAETLVFMGFDGEEEGLIGSSNYVKSLSRMELKAIKGMLNFDNLGAGYGPFVLEGSQPLLDKALSALKAMSLRAEGVPLGGGSDHAPFAEAITLPLRKRACPC